MSFRRRRTNDLRPVDSVKNIVQNVAITAAAATTTFVLVTAGDTAALATSNQVKRGCRINTVYLEVWLYGNAVAGVNSPITWAIQKSPGNSIASVQPSAAGVDADKKWVMAMGKGLVGASGNGQPGYLIRGWFSIPKKWRRFDSSDQLRLLIENNTANDLNVCQLCIYKWYQ